MHFFLLFIWFNAEKTLGSGNSNQMLMLSLPIKAKEGQASTKENLVNKSAKPNTASNAAWQLSNIIKSNAKHVQ